MDHENIWSYKKFPNPIDPTENILLILRKNYTVLNGELTIGLGLILLGFFSKLMLQNYLFAFDNSSWFYFINMSYYIFICLLMLRFAFFCHNYFLSFWAFTPLRIIEYNQNNFFQADVNSIWYKNIEKLELKTEKASNTISNFGNIDLKMQGEGEQKRIITLANIPSPKSILQLLETLRR